MKKIQLFLAMLLLFLGATTAQGQMQGTLSSTLADNTLVGISPTPFDVSLEASGSAIENADLWLYIELTNPLYKDSLAFGYQDGFGYHEIPLGLNNGRAYMDIPNVSIAAGATQTIGYLGVLSLANMQHPNIEYTISIVDYTDGSEVATSINTITRNITLLSTLGPVSIEAIGLPTTSLSSCCDSLFAINIAAGDSVGKLANQVIAFDDSTQASLLHFEYLAAAPDVWQDLLFLNRPITGKPGEYMIWDTASVLATGPLAVRVKATPQAGIDTIKFKLLVVDGNVVNGTQTYNGIWATSTEYTIYTDNLKNVSITVDGIPSSEISYRGDILDVTFDAGDKSGSEFKNAIRFKKGQTATIDSLRLSYADGSSDIWTPVEFQNHPVGINSNEFLLWYGDVQTASIDGRVEITLLPQKTIDTVSFSLLFVDADDSTKSWYESETYTLYINTMPPSISTTLSDPTIQCQMTTADIAIVANNRKNQGGQIYIQLDPVYKDSVQIFYFDAATQTYDSKPLSFAADGTCRFLKNSPIYLTDTTVRFGIRNLSQADHSGVNCSFSIIEYNGDPVFTTWSEVDTVTVDLIACPSPELISITTTQGTLSPAFDPETANYNLVLPCGVSSTSLSFTARNQSAIIIIDGTDTESPTYTHTITLDKPGTEPVTVKVQLGEESITYTINVTKLFGQEVVKQAWNDVLTVVNVPGNNGGYNFSDYQWYQNGVKMDGETGYNLYLTNPNTTNSYYVVLTTNDGTTAPSCPISLTTAKVEEQQIKVYPNPTTIGTFTITAKAGDFIEIYNLNSQLVATYKASDKETLVNISQLPKGTYLVKVNNEIVKVVKN